MYNCFDALAHAHSMGIVHRDLKPSNIMITPCPTKAFPLAPVLLDFGLALLDGLDPRNAGAGGGGVALEGTIPYESPEQINGQPLTPKVDVYALGQIFWEMLVGRLAWVDMDNKIGISTLCSRKVLADSGLQILPADSPASSSIDTPFSCQPLLPCYHLLPATVISLIERCTRPDPEKRPSAAKACRVLGRAVQAFMWQAGNPYEVQDDPKDPTVPGPFNMGFHCIQKKTGFPLGWFDAQGHVDNVSVRGYKCARVSPTIFSFSGEETPPRDAHNRSLKGRFGCCMQKIPAAPLRGLIIRFAADIRPTEVRRMAGLWLRIDSDQWRPLFFDNMARTPIQV